MSCLGYKTKTAVALSGVSSCATERRRRSLRGDSGMTLLELIIACGILLILASVALPLERVTLIRHRETELRYDLREMRDAIDRYKDASDKNQIKVAAGTEGYPPDLDTLVKGVKLAGPKDEQVRFLREIPVDPFTNNKDWGLRSVQDDPDTTSWGGQDVFDVYSKSTGTALDGTKYSDW
ncbi:MAG TPA: type II secretion system protein [Candidatus Acidoferrales bacterium]|nr:type II secretion system protein [Candidatus Acidoferrales bacterium]